MTLLQYVHVACKEVSFNTLTLLVYFHEVHLAGKKRAVVTTKDAFSEIWPNLV